MSTIRASSPRWPHRDDREIPLFGNHAPILICN
nr:MAG TPA: hypothetical protein [Caudoviricetes sp.]